jgi:dolichol-phosphate mannosyltransferase
MRMDTVAVVIPCYRVKNKIGSVLFSIPSFVTKIYIVDDLCPEGSGKYVEENFSDQRIKVIYNRVNMGVGGAVKEGYKLALADNCDVVVKIDGDGQMNGNLIPDLINPIIKRNADYVKGNRFFIPEDLRSMPFLRLVGNSALSLINKIVNGYWDIMDPTNGFTAICKSALKGLPLDKIENRYFFESDMLFRLSLSRAVVADLPMKAVYNDEKSSLNIKKVILDFPPKYLNRYFKRIFYLYFLRDFTIASLELFVGFLLFLFGIIFGFYKWYLSSNTGEVASSGTVMLSALPIIIGFQLLLSALNFDIHNVPKKPLNQ